MALTELDITTRAQDLIFDTTAIRWPIAELRRWLNDGQRVIAMAKPDATAHTQSIQLAQGVKQSLPAGTIRLLDVIRNMGWNGATPGRGIRLTEQEALSAYSPDWATAEESTAVKHFMYDERTPLEFYVYPPVPASPPVYVEVKLSLLPTDTTGPTSTLSIGDWYASTLLDCILYRALSKDADQGPNGPAQTYYQAVANALGIEAAANLKSSPNSATENGQTPKALRG